MNFNSIINSFNIYLERSQRNIFITFTVFVEILLFNGTLHFRIPPEVIIKAFTFGSLKLSVY